MPRLRRHLGLLGVLGVLGLGCSGTPRATGPADGASDGASDGAASDGRPPLVIDAPPGPPGSPHVGGHALAYFRLTSNVPPLRTPAMTTQPSGSTLVVSTGRGALAATAAPTDTFGNTFAQLGTSHAYTNWPSSGTALYAAATATGGAGHVISVTTPYDDEITMAAVEVVDGGAIQDVQWNEVLAGNPLTSRSVTTTGPATLVAFWWGDAGAEGDKTATPDGGFVVTDAILAAGSLVQCAVATRDVTAAGTYAVTWTATPTQGAQLWLVAVQ